MTEENTATLAREHSAPNVTTNREKLLRFFAKRCVRPGRDCQIAPTLDFAVIDVIDVSEFQSYLRWLTAEDLIESNSTNSAWRLTFAGWKEVEPHFGAGGIPGTCFVPMWFDGAMSEAYELGLQPAIEDDCGFKAIRIDRTEHNNQITDEIMAAIRSAEFMVADFTGHRAGVYYEAGFARGLGRSVVYCCREDAFKDRHFDYQRHQSYRLEGFQRPPQETR